MSADSPRRTTRGVPAIVPPQVVSDRSIIDSVAGFINDVTLTNQPQGDPKDTIIWAKFETTADISDPTYGEDWELEGNVAPPLLLILGYGLGVQVWAIPANGEAVEVLSWRHGNVTALRILPTPISSDVEMADEPVDQFADKRPLMAICEGSPPGCNSQFSSVNFISLKHGNQVKTIKFKNTVLDILANRISIVITFPERIAVFDARTFEDRLSVTSCYPSPGIVPNPVALGSRWLAYSENKLMHSKRSGGGCDGDGVSSYTATVLNAAKSLGKGLRELGEQVAAGLTGTSGTGSFSKPGSFDSGTGDIKQPGVITILDIKHSIKDVSPTTGSPISVIGTDPFIAHFVAHLEAIVALEFDNSGMLLLTADKRGHDFHVFRIQPHPAGSQLASVHHLYVLHRGDTSAKVQNIAFSLDSRWVAVSTLRGTTHVFPINPYGGPAGVRTHASLHVVNRLSRFHRSAGLSADGRSSSPISHSDSTTFNQVCMPYNNPTIPPFPRPHVVLPLAQLRQPSVLGSPPGSAQNSYVKSSHGRQRLSSLSDDTGKPLSVCAVFAKPRSWLLDPPNLTRDTPAHKIQRKPIDSLFIMAGHGALIQYDLDTKLASNVAKEKICDDTPIELEVEAKAQWNLGRKEGSVDIQPPLPLDNWLNKERNTVSNNDTGNSSDDDDRWLSQVEIITHAGPHRRLWMGPQCVFKTYNTLSGASLSHIDTEAVEIGVSTGSNRPGRSSPMNLPLSGANRSSVPVLIESGSYSSIEQSPKLMDRFRHEHLDSDFAVAHGESRLKEDLADAMRESPSVPHKETGITPPRKSSQISLTSNKSTSTATPATSNSEINNYSSIKKYSEDDEDQYSSMALPSASFPSKLPSLSSNVVEQKQQQQQQDEQEEQMQQKHYYHQHHYQQPTRSVVLIEKVVNPLGTVTTITRSPSDNGFETANQYFDYVIHENCDEALFRPVVAIFCDDEKNHDVKNVMDSESEKPPEPIGTELVVPVIEKNENRKLEGNSKKNKKANTVTTASEKMKSEEKEVVAKFDELSLINKKSKVNNAKKQNKFEKEKTPPSAPTSVATDKPIESCENANNFTKKVKLEKKKLKEDTGKCPEGESQPVKLDDSKEDQNVKTQNTKKTNDREKIRDMPEDSNEKILEESKTKISEAPKSRNRKHSKSGSGSEGETVEKSSKKRNSNEIKLEDIDNIFRGEKVSKQLPKVSSDPKLSKFKSDYTVVDIKPASSEKSLKKKDKGNKQQQQQQLLKNNLKVKSSSDNKLNAEKDSEHSKSDRDSPDGIQFYEKFSRDSPKNTSPSDKEIIITQFHDVDDGAVDFPSLIPSISGSADSKKSKKSKQPSPKSSSPQHSPKLSSKQSSKDIQSVLDDAKQEDSVEPVTFTFVAKKQSKKSTVDQVKEKRFDDFENAQLPKDLLDESPPKVKYSDEKNSKREKKNGKTKDFPALSFKPLSEELSESFLPHLSPLEPFESKFENLYIKDVADDHVSLMIFESPLQETQKSKSSEFVKSSSEVEGNLNRKCSEENIIFALCGSLHYDETRKNCENGSQPSNFSTIECESDKDCSKTSQYKSFERLNDNDEQYLSLEQNNYHEHTSASSSEETEESAYLTTIDGKCDRNKLTEDDEELRPLIGGANSACSMTSSISGKQSDNDTAIALEIAKAISATLPDNNQSDLSDQANSSEPGEMDGDIPTSGSSDSNEPTVTAFKSNGEDGEDDEEGRNNSVKQQQQQQQQQTQLNSNIVCCGGTQTNGKKKSKKKKR